MTKKTAPKYKTIVADPPWRYDREQNIGTNGVPYSTMSTEDVMRVAVPELAATDCLLFLWSTNAHLPQAFRVMAEWGFTYKTTLTWAKTNMGVGYWLRGQTEHALLGIKGTPAKIKGVLQEGAVSASTLIKDIETLSPMEGAKFSNMLAVNVGGFIEHARGAHSEKPQAFLDLAEQLGDPPYMELFARRMRLGWDAMGLGIGRGVPFRPAESLSSTPRPSSEHV